MDIYKLRSELALGRSLFDLPLKIAYYTRVSTTSNDQLHSLKNQQYFFKDLIDKNSNWTLVKGYVDEGITGTSVKNRESFLKMIHDAKLGLFDLILTKEVSRFARNTLECLKFTRELLTMGVGVYFLNDNITTVTNEGELRLTIMSSLAQDESRKISERVKFSYKTRVERGVIAGNNRIWGFIKKNSSLVVEEEEAKLVRDIFYLYVEGHGFRKISDLLAQKGFKNHNGNPFTYSTLKSILTNPKYKGYFCANKSTTLDFISKQRKYFDKSKWVLHKDENIPVIVPEEIWNKANLMLQERADKMRASDKTSYQKKHAYSGKIFCQKHQSSYWHNILKYDKMQKEIWQCKIYRQKGRNGCNGPALNQDEIDAVLKTILKDTQLFKEYSIKLLCGIYESVNNDLNDANSILHLGIKLKEYRQQKERLLSLHLAGHLSEEEFCTRNAQIKGEIELACVKMDELTAGQHQKTFKHESNDLHQELQNLFDFDPHFQRELAREFLEKVEVLECPVSNVVILNVQLKNGQEALAFLINKELHLSRSTHLIRADIETEIAPLVGSEKQSEELLNYLVNEFESDKSKLWESNIFGKSLHELVNEGLNNKLGKMPHEARLKLKETLQRIINEGSNGLVCIII